MKTLIRRLSATLGLAFSFTLVSYGVFRLLEDFHIVFSSGNFGTFNDTALVFGVIIGAILTRLVWKGTRSAMCGFEDVVLWLRTCTEAQEFLRRRATVDTDARCILQVVQGAAPQLDDHHLSDYFQQPWKGCACAKKRKKSPLMKYSVPLGAMLRAYFPYTKKKIMEAGDAKGKAPEKVINNLKRIAIELLILEEKSHSAQYRELLGDIMKMNARGELLSASDLRLLGEIVR